MILFYKLISFILGIIISLIIIYLVVFIYLYIAKCIEKIKIWLNKNEISIYCTKEAKDYYNEIYKAK